MTTFYRFAVPRDGCERAYRDTVLYHIERLLLLGRFRHDQLNADPIGLILDNDNTIHELFADRLAHIWTPEAVETTKAQLKVVRSTENVDDFYDIDVLRMTEPRILFIYETLRCFNQLPECQRLEAMASFGPVEHLSMESGPQELSATFGRYLSSLISSVTFVGKNGPFLATEFVFESAVAAQSVQIEEMPYCLQNFFIVFFRTFQRLIEVEFSGSQISSFRLRSYEHWTSKSAGEPFEILGVLSRDCNAKCDFCYVLGNPSNTAIKLQKFTNRGSSAEAKVRLEYFERGLKLPIPTYDTEEITTHPAFLKTCESIRNSTARCISVTTNGYRLNNDLICRLKALAPIDISLSLNSASPNTRAWLMGGPHKHGLEALELLDRHSIPCAVTIVAWPRVPIQEIIGAIRYADQFNARSISVLLGGYTRLFPNPPEYQIPAYWDYVITAIHQLRAELETPLIIQPRLYEEQLRFSKNLGASIVTGINKYSSAKCCGAEIYDEIISINQRSVTTRNECLSLLTALSARKSIAELVLRRKGKDLDVSIDPRHRDDRYLYDSSCNDRYGIHLIGESIPIKAIRAIFVIAAKHQAKKVLFLTSLIVRPLLAATLERYASLSEGEIELDLQIPKNEFLGGNIVVGDMLVVDDFVAFLDGYLADNSPDLVLIPSGPFNHGGWHRDMKGQPFELLRRMYRVPVEMIEAPYFE